MKISRSSRIIWISWLQALAVTFVVLGHSLPEDVVLQNPLTVVWIRNFAYSFHIPLFFSLSGFLFLQGSGKDKAYWILLKEKAQQLLLPYFMLGIFAYIPHYLLNKFAQHQAELSILAFVESFLIPREHAIRFFWFLPVLFLCFVCTPFLKKSIKSFYLTFLMFSLLAFCNILRPVSVSWFGINIAAIYLVFFYLGMLLHTSHFLISNSRVRSVLLPLIVPSFVILYYFFWYAPASSHLLQTLLEFLLAVAGIGVWWLLLQKISTSPRIVSLLSQYSYPLFLLSIFPQLIFKILYQIGVVNYWLTVGGMFISGLVVPIAITYVLKKYFPRIQWVIGLK